MFASLYTPVEGEEEGETKKKKKKGKKVGFASDADKTVRVIKMKRSGKKIICAILGLDAYGVDLEVAARILSKKMGTGAASMMIEYRELKV